MLDNLDEKIDNVQAHVDTVNSKLKKTLEDKGLGAERCCINIICLVLLLGIVGVIFNMLKGGD